MKKIVLILILFSIKGYSQVLDSKDSCITANPIRGLKNSWLPLRANWVEDEFKLFIDQHEFEHHFRRANIHKRDSIISLIDFNKNNVIIFTTSTGGCRMPTIIPEYYQNNMIQLKVTWNGTCMMKIPITQYIIVPKEIPVNIKVRVCKVYNSNNN